MRTLAINKTKLWIVNPTGSTPLLDSNGFDTGEVVKTFSVPTQVSMALYPFGGTVAERIFGKDTSLDMMAISNDVILTEDTLLFINQPISNFETTYDYRIFSIKKSINTYNYGLRNRT